MNTQGQENTVAGMSWIPRFAVACLLIVVCSRVIGPVDLWDQTQPRTISYTVDMVDSGGSSWILPRDDGGLPATKPPMFNWMAAPAVELIGSSSTFAHKIPSLVALVLLFLLVAKTGEDRVVGCGWLAAIMLVCSYPIYKLGYLARPDMILLLWIFAGYCAANRVLLRECSGRGGDATASLVFWICVALSILTKGPVAVLLPAYAVLIGLISPAGFGSLRRLGWWWGVPLALVLGGGWYIMVGVLDRDHLVNQLWFNEFYGRLTGTGPEGSEVGTWGLLLGILNMPFYFLVRFAPWSFLGIVAMLALVDRRNQSEQSAWRGDPNGRWLLALAIQVLLPIILFSLSAGKRADYIAPCYPAAALLASWWFLDDRWAIRYRMIRVVPVIASVILVVLVVNNEIGSERGRDSLIGYEGIVDDVSLIRSKEPFRIATFRTKLPHVGSMVGASGETEINLDRFQDLVRVDEPLWILVGTDMLGPGEKNFVEELIGSGRLYSTAIWMLPDRDDQPDHSYAREISLFRKEGREQQRERESTP